jgi:predicted nucleotidyltransferase
LNIPILGSNIPNMGIQSQTQSIHKSQNLASALFSTTQQRLLAWLFGQPERSFYSNELIKLSGGGSGAIQRELTRLSESGLITIRRIGNQKHYQANPESPIFHELQSITRKTVGLAEPLREALMPLSKHISAAFIYGSIAKQRDTALSDIDLLVISDKLTYADIFSALESTSLKLGRPINPTVYTSNEITQRIKRKNPFVTKVIAQEKIWLFGNEDDLAA